MSLVDILPMVDEYWSDGLRRQMHRWNAVPLNRELEIDQLPLATVTERMRFGTHHGTLHATTRPQHALDAASGALGGECGSMPPFS